uniref:Uncharacterized protein n=1 Tax=Anguilla anguilla TaxID=7936 RepID=A0A0E9UDR9_ANGAN
MPAILGSVRVSPYLRCCTICLLHHSVCTPVTCSTPGELSVSDSAG